MSDRVKIAACQVPDIREDLDNALKWIEACAASADAQGVNLLCFPECFLQGYLLDEPIARRYALNLTSEAFEQVLERLSRINPTLVFGMIEIERGILFNTAVVVSGGKLRGSYRKIHLLTGERMFSAGDSCPVFDVGTLRFGINICYDTNFPESGAAIARQGADLIESCLEARRA